MRPIVLLLVALLSALPAAAAPRVVASIPPVHGLVAAVMAGAGAPRLLVPAGASPHDFALRPSDASALAEAELVVTVGAGLEGGIGDAAATLAEGARLLVLAEVPGVEPIPLDPDHGHDHGAAAGAIDPHLWLDPTIAALWLEPIAEALAAVDPANAALYRANAATTAEALDALVAETERRLAPVAGRDYAVLHDAWRYFERRFGLAPAARLVPATGGQPGARRLAEARARLAALDSPCLFAEPQQDRALAEAVAADTGARLAVLDPLGAGLPPGPGFYQALIRGIADGLAACLLAEE